MDKVPINFEHQGKQFAGHLVPVMGLGGTNIFHLMIDNFYTGQLSYTDRWVFNPTPKTESFKEATTLRGGINR